MMPREAEEVYNELLKVVFSMTMVLHILKMVPSHFFDKILIDYEF